MTLSTFKTSFQFFWSGLHPILGIAMVKIPHNRACDFISSRVKDKVGKLSFFGIFRFLHQVVDVVVVVSSLVPE